MIFHRLVQKDMDGIRRYYIDESGYELADRFYDAFMFTVNKALSNPHHYHRIEENSRIRRAALKGFPYHFLYRKTATGIRVPLFCVTISVAAHWA